MAENSSTDEQAPEVTPEGISTEPDVGTPADPEAVTRPPYAGPYKESDEHVPNPYFQYAQVDTTGVGAAASSIEDISPIFAVHRRDALGLAADELSNGTNDANAHTVLPTDRDPEETLAEVQQAAGRENEADPAAVPADDGGDPQEAQEGQEDKS
jgi:hypothetical protein